MRLVGSEKTFVQRLESHTSELDFRLIADPDPLVVQPVVHGRDAEQGDIEGRLGHAAVVEVDKADLLTSDQYLLGSKRTVSRNERVGGDSDFQSAQRFDQTVY